MRGLVGILLVSGAAASGMRADDVCTAGKCGQSGAGEGDIGSMMQMKAAALQTKGLTVTKVKGAAWGEDLVKDVLAKLNYIFDKPARVVNSIYPQNSKKENPDYECMDITINGNTTEGCSKIQGASPSPEKVLRMGFHDCVKYSDGSGGCDGCMHFKGMFKKYQTTMGRRRKLNGKHLPDYVEFAGDNNNLALTADVLEALYTDPAFPSMCTTCHTLSQSLQQGGQSRADLWALATLLAAQHGFKANEDMCAGKLPADSDNNIQKALAAYGRDYQCSVSTSRRLTFYSGRADCTEMKPDVNDKSKWYRRRAYETDKKEVGGNSHWDGQRLQDFMASDFGFTPRETVAIMGAHSFATFNIVNSMFSYEWKRATGNMLNNEYYQLVALRPHLNKQTKPFAVVGGRGRTSTNETGGLAQSRWMIRRKDFLAGGGPWQWSHQNQRCPYCKYDAEAIKWVVKEPANGGGKYFRSEHCCNECAKSADDTSFDKKCLEWISQDEEALSVDAGLYIDFSFNSDTGKPLGCGLGDSLWKAESPHCEKQQIKNPEDGMAMYQIVEEYADNQQIWATDFIAALEKMLSNGAEPGSLKQEYVFPEVSSLP